MGYGIIRCSSFLLSSSLGMYFNSNRQGMTKKWHGGGGCWLIQTRGLVSLSVCLQLNAHYCPCCLCLSLPGPRLIPGLPFDRADSRQGKNNSWFVFILGWEGAGKLMVFINEYSIFSPWLWKHLWSLNDPRLGMTLADTECARISTQSVRCVAQRDATETHAGSHLKCGVMGTNRCVQEKRVLSITALLPLSQARARPNYQILRLLMMVLIC